MSAIVTARPTRVRYWVIVFAVALAVITYIDRVSLGSAEISIRTDLGLTHKQMGLVFTCFGIAYALFRNSQRIPGRCDRSAQGTDADRAVVVVFHRRHRFGFQPRVAGCDSVPVRRRRGGMLPESNQDFHHMASERGKSARAGHHVVERALGRRFHSSAGGLGDANGGLAARVRDFRLHRVGLDAAVLPLVPQRSITEPQAQHCGTRTVAGKRRQRVRAATGTCLGQSLHARGRFG